MKEHARHLVLLTWWCQVKKKPDPSKERKRKERRKENGGKPDIIYTPFSAHRSVPALSPPWSRDLWIVRDYVACSKWRQGTIPLASPCWQRYTLLTFPLVVHFSMWMDVSTITRSGLERCLKKEIKNRLGGSFFFVKSSCHEPYDPIAKSSLGRWAIRVG